MQIKKIFSLLLLLFSFVILKSQIVSPPNGSISPYQNNNDLFPCASEEMSIELYKKFPDRKLKLDQLEKSIQNVLLNTQQMGGVRGPVYTIPVVVHIIHNNGLENISNLQVIQGIQDLNQAFSNSGVYVDANGVDVEIQFCLAQRDPNGNATSGITRDVSPLTNMTMETDDINLKNINRWNPNDYVNIWLVNEITSQAMGSGVAGYAYLPGSHGNPEDGIVNEAKFFGASLQTSKVHVHEVGHYLGLYHTFQGGCTNNNCLTDGDRVCDTPPDNSIVQVSCTSTINTCSTDDDDLSTNNPFRPIANGGIGDQNDLIQNHMDYGDIPCHTLFTAGQKNRMRTALTTARASLLQSNGCLSPCTSPILLSFSASATTVTIGTNVTFTNSSTGTITGYDWSINNTSFAITQNANYTFNTTGKFWVVLTMNNNDPNCKKQDSVLIKVECDAQAAFTSGATNIQPGAQITFTSTSIGATTYQWFIDGVPQVSTANFTHTFPAAGGYMVYLVVCGANCCDTSKFQYVQVGICQSKEANIWYFGYNAGVDFNSGTSVAVNNSAMGYNSEGSASICDKNGQLLFYTNGVSVWNRNHGVMPNGTGLWGNQTTTQSAIIIPMPGSKTLYYIFTCDFQGGEYVPNPNPIPGSFAYSIVDMTLAGGFGDVSVKNQLLYTPTTEKLTAVRHANGTDVWIVTHEWKTDKFRSYLLTCSGLDLNPVISQSGIVHDSIPGATTSPGRNATGHMNISPDGKKIAVALTGANKLEILDFDTNTGKVSTQSGLVSFTVSQAYGLTFSPNSSRLYYNSVSGQSLYQLNLNAGSPAAIIASATSIGSTLFLGSLQIGPDGKIYVFKNAQSNLSVIHNPNALGVACNFSDNYLNLLGINTSTLGCPNFLIDLLTAKKASKIQGDSIICKPHTYYIKNNCGVNGDSIIWILNGNSAITSIVDSAITITPTQIGTDTLISIQYAACGIVSDTLIIQTKTGGPIINLGKDTVVCSPTIVQLNAGAGFNNYLWSTTATTQSINAANSGTYWVEVSDTSGCKSRDTINVVHGSSKPNVNLGADKIVCSGKVIPLDAGTGYMNYTWYDNTHNQTNTTWLPGTYWVTVLDSCGNSSSDTIKVITDNSGVSLGADKEICENETIALDAGNGFITYLWQDGSSNQAYTVSDTGTYFVHVITNDGCEYSDTIRINDCTIKIDDCEIGIPDAFSPNGDGVNDEFKILGKCVDKITLVIFDRWGEKVFETNDPAQSWDGKFKGKEMNNAVFAYYLKVTTFKGTELQFKGNVSLIK